MNKKTPRVCILARACFVGLAVFVQPALSADWTPQLSIPAKGSYGPSDAIQIVLPKLSYELLQRLTLELDDIDVTGLATREPHRLVFTPPQAMTWGQHHLRLVEHTPDGDIIERGVWTLEVRKNSRFREAEFDSHVTLNLVQRIADADLVNAPKRTQTNAGAQLRGAIANNDWRVSGNADVLYNSQEAQMPLANNSMGMGTYLLTGSAGRFSVNAGHHNAVPDSLIMQNYTQRGVSASVSSAETGTSLTGFGVSTEDIAVTQEGSDSGEVHSRIKGVTATAHPVSSDRDALLVAATYLSGVGANQISIGAGGDTTVTSGRAGGLIADGNLIEKHVRLRGEYAATEFDFDGPDSGSPPEHDQAYSAVAIYTPWHQLAVKNQPMAISVGVENKRIGTFFRSPAAPSASTDREGIRGFASFDWFGLNAQLSLGHETDNVNDLTLLPRTQAKQGVVALTYAPLQIPTPEGQLPSPAWYGQPIYNITYADMDQVVKKAAATLASGALHATRYTTLSAMFNYTTWNWSISHTYGKDDDFINAAPDTESRMTQLSTYVRLGEKFWINPGVQFSEVANRDNRNLDSDTTTAGLNLGYAYSQKISSNLGYSVNRQHVNDGSTNTRSHDLIGDLSWMLQPAQGRKPGITLALEGQHHDTEDRVTSSNDQNYYQVFLKISVAWQVTY